MAASEPSSAVAAGTVPSPDAVEQLPSMPGAKYSRMDTSNFGANRTPCGCTENDEDEDVVSRKRTKATAKCQVETCGADLGKLKGYHQRHRVCLQCANAITVSLKGEAHRYCQQCGKFHMLSDFDDEKRSCRRKLERHNTRRRRKLSELGEAGAAEAGESNNEKGQGNADRQADEILAEGKSTPSPERETSDSIEHAPGSLEVDTGPASTLSSTLGSSTMDAPPFPTDRCCDTSVTSSLDTLQTSVMCGLSHSGMQLAVTGGLQSCMQEPQLLSGQTSAAEGGLQPGRGTVIASHGYENPAFSEEPGAGSTYDMDQMSAGLSAGSWQGAPSGFPEDLVGQQFTFAAGRSRVEDESLLSFLLQDDVHEDNFFPNAKSSNFPIAPDLGLFHQPPSRVASRKPSTYSSPFPTGRISFKLYDWNPGDFPRRLRQQILEWIGNMPVELEGYIRSGCTILTLVLSMHQQMWHHIEQDWPAFLTRLVDGPGSGFWGTGNYIACVGDSVCQVCDGDVTELQNIYKPKQAVLDYVWPVCLQVGSPTTLDVYGHNLQRGGVRPFISFNGRYLKANREEILYDMAEQNHREGGKWCQIRSALIPDRSGVVYVEIENDSGTSNHIPVLVADRHVCAEVQTLVTTLGLFSDVKFSGETASNWDMIHALIQDLGWVLSYSATCEPRKIQDAVAKSKWHSIRLRRLIRFALAQNMPAVAGHVLSSAVFCCLGSAGEAYHPSLQDLPHICDETTLNFLHMWMRKAGAAQVTEPLGQQVHRSPGPVEVHHHVGVAYPYLQNSEVVVSIKDINLSSMDGQDLKRSLITEKAASEKGMTNLFMGRGGKRLKYRNPIFANQHLRIGGRSVMTMVGVMAVCIGACLIFQHPAETMEYLSGSLRRCLWGHADGQP